MYKALDKKDKKYYALKIMDVDFVKDKQYLKEIADEINCMKKLKSPNIV